MKLTNTYPSLKDKVVFITGGASGIGAHFVEHFARQHARVYFCDIDTIRAEKLLHTLAPISQQVYFTAVDVTDVDALHACIDQIGTKNSRIDVLINNAASDDRHTLDDLTPTYWDTCFHINLRPHVFAIQRVKKYMPAHGGAIVNMGSVSWMRRRPNMVGYTTAKGAIHAMTRTLAQELGHANIRINSIVPGAVLTERQKALWATPELEQSFYDDQALHIRVLPEDITAMALFLASDDSRACSGQNFIIDAGIV